MTTIKDVANKAEVSVATVSRVLNNKGYLKEETKKKVEKVIKELDYTPNSVAKTLYTKKSDTIGVLIPDITNPFFSELYTTIEDYAEKQGQQLLLFNSNYDINREKKLLKQLNSKLIDSVIIISENLTEKDLLNVRIPTVILDRKISEKISSISVDNYKGGKRAARYLLDSGCEMIAHITGPKYNEAAIERTKGFYDEMKNSKVKYTVVQGIYDVKKVVKLFLNLFRDHPTIDGVFAGNDIIAIGVIKALSRVGNNKKISIIGFDGISLGEDITPEITTMCQPIDEIASNAIDIIMSDKKQSHKTFNTKLLIRET